MGTVYVKGNFKFLLYPINILPKNLNHVTHINRDFHEVTKTNQYSIIGL